MQFLKNITENSFTELFSKNKYPLFLTIIFAVFLIVFWGRLGDPIVDCGREAYIPYAMADLGKVLFKDIICIYGPVPYYINAFVVRLFGPSLNVLYSIGAFLSYAFMLTLFLIIKRFLSEKPAFFIILFVMFSCVFSPFIFNYIFPYSYAILYALVFSAFCLYFIFKFIETGKSVFLLFAALSSALMFLSKFDFLPAVIVLPVIIFLYRKKLSKKDIIASFFTFLFPFFLVGLAFAFQKVSISDLIFNFKMISNMAHSESLKYFYSHYTGYFFNIKRDIAIFLPFLKSFFIMALFFISGFYFSKIKSRVLKFILFFILVIIAFPSFVPVFFFFPQILVLLSLGAILYYLLKKPEIPDKEDFLKRALFILFSILISIKILFGLVFEVYGTYYLPWIFISIILILDLVFINRKKDFKNAVILLNIALSLFFFIKNYNILIYQKNIPFVSKAGKIFIAKGFSGAINPVYNFLQNNLNSDENFLILPEGLFFNFALQKAYPYYNTSFIPLDFEAYGEDYLIENVMKNQPKYLIITSRDSSDYGKSFICKDYGQKFCASFSDLYIHKQTFGSTEYSNPFLMYVFERKDNVKR